MGTKRADRARTVDAAAATPDTAGRQSARVVLVSEAYIAALEAELRSLRAALARRGASGDAEPFRLIGSATLRVPADQILRASRARQAELAAAKRRAS